MHINDYALSAITFNQQLRFEAYCLRQLCNNMRLNAASERINVQSALKEAKATLQELSQVGKPFE